MQRMTLLVAMTLIGLSLFNAHAQTTGSPGSPKLPATTGQAVPPAPTGHRQPRATDVPNEAGTTISPADRETDQKLNICSDCR